MFLLVEGQQGSGKTFLSETLKRILDPNAIARSRLPDNEPDLMLQAGTYFLPVYDNTSGMKADLSDTLCAIATGGSIQKTPCRGLEKPSDKLCANIRACFPASDFDGTSK